MGLLLFIPLVVIVVLGVRARVHEGGGRGAGICIRRVSVRRDVEAMSRHVEDLE